MLKKNAMIGMMSAALGLGVTPLASADLIGHWEFESAPGGATPDSTGNGHTGTLEGSANLTVDSMRGSVLELSGLGVDSDGVNIDATTPIPTLAANRGATLAAWINRNSGVSAGDRFSYVIGLGASGDAPVITLGITASTGFVTGFIEGDGGADQVEVIGNTTVLDQVWTHIAITYDRVNNEAITYVNGVAGPTIDISSVGDGSLDWDFAAIGRIVDASGTDARHFGGLIDDARYYDHVLSGSEIAGLVPEPGSLALLGLGGLLIARRRRV